MKNKKIKQNKTKQNKKKNKQNKTKRKPNKQTNKQTNKQNKTKARSTDLLLTALFSTPMTPSFKMVAVEMASCTVFPPGL